MKDTPVAAALKQLVRQYAIDYADYRSDFGFDGRDEILKKLEVVEDAIDQLVAQANEWRDAYLNMRTFAEANGLDTTTRN